MYISICCGALIRNLLSPEKPSEQTFERLQQTLTNNYKPQRIIIAERLFFKSRVEFIQRFRFNKRNQGDNESLADYSVALKQLASSCEFGAFLNEAMRDRFVCGLRHESIQKRLLADKDVTFNTACDVAHAMELAARDTLKLSGKPTTATMDVHRLTTARNQGNRFAETR